MRHIGTMTEWNDVRGFGFVTPNDGSERAFVHIKSFERTTIRPDVGTLISYELQQDQQGRFNATDVRFVIEQSPRLPAHRREFPRKGLGALFLIAIACGRLCNIIPASIALTYGAMSGLAIWLYGMDKAAAINNRWRTRESTLHLVGMLGGWPGALFAQEAFRHKSKKVEFQILFWLTVAINCGGLVWFLSSGPLMVSSPLVDEPNLPIIRPAIDDRF